MEEFDFGGEIVWRPTQEHIERTHLKRFMNQHHIETLDELMRRSTTDIEWFWSAVLEDLGIQFYEPYEKVVDLSNGAAWARWCVGGKLNIVHNALDKWIGTATQNRAAIRWEGEEGVTRVLTYGDLYRQVNRLANGLRALGLNRGDIIGLYMPMTPEIAVALLAIVKIGGIILPLFSGYGAGAIATRLIDSGAKALFTSDGVFRRGQLVRMKPAVDEAIAAAEASGRSDIKHVIVHHRAGIEVHMHAGRDHDWNEIIEDQPPLAPTERTNADDPLMLIYTSGTTGRPKGAVHTHCGFPIKAAQDMMHGLDVHDYDTLYWITDMGWMMGPWEVFGTLLLGGTIVFYDGAPDHPAPDRLWAMVERHGITLLGVSPTLIRSLMKFGEEPIKAHDVSSLRAFASTGEPWNPTPWLWLFHTVGGGKLPIINYSGGTEISGGIVMGNWLKPLKPCAFSGPLPGMAADVVDETGKSVRGQVGELVIRKPWIGMTRGFWKDPDRYIQAYWSRFPDVWVHGDWAAVDEDDLWYILGRSDDVIKVAGKRLGPAEVESALVKNPAVQESAAIGVPDEVKGEAVVCFCILKPNIEPSDALRLELKNQVANELGKPLAPHDILFVRDLPRTRNAKIMRRVIRAVYLGKEAGDTSSLENPAAVEEIKRAVQRQP
jgi:acetyl-CoA synthetase